MKRIQLGNFSSHSDFYLIPFMSTHISIYLCMDVCMHTSTPSDFSATIKHCCGHGNRAGDVKCINLWRSCLCVWLSNPAAPATNTLCNVQDPPEFPPSFLFPFQCWHRVKALHAIPASASPRARVWVCPWCGSSLSQPHCGNFTFP